MGLLDTYSFLQQTFKCPHVPGIGWDGKAVGSTGILGQSSKRWVWKSSSDGDCQTPSLTVQDSVHHTGAPAAFSFPLGNAVPGLDSREQCGRRIIRWNWQSRCQQELGYMGACFSVCDLGQQGLFLFTSSSQEQIRETAEDSDPGEGCFLDLSLIRASSRGPCWPCEHTTTSKQTRQAGPAPGTD